MMGIYAVLRRVKSVGGLAAVEQPVVSRPMVLVPALDHPPMTWLLSPGNYRISADVARLAAGNSAQEDEAQSRIVRRYNPKRRMAPF